MAGVLLVATLAVGCTTTVVNFGSADAAAERNEGGPDLGPPDVGQPVDVGQPPDVALDDGAGDAVARSCTTQMLGTDTTCFDVPTWKDLVSQACNGSGLQLEDYTLTVDCDGSTFFRLASYVCCTKNGSPAPDDGGTVVPTSGQFVQYKCCLSNLDCTVESQGSSTTCNDLATWEASASLSCESKGRTLAPGSLGLSGSC